MADIPVESTATIPLWAGLLGLGGLVLLVWVLFQIGAGGVTPAGTDTAEAQALALLGTGLPLG